MQVQGNPTRRRDRVIALAVVCGACGLFVTGGCSPSPEDRIKAAMRQSFQLNGKRLAIMYGRCMASPDGPVTGPNGFRGPADEAALRRFIANVPKAALEEMGIKDPDDPALFLSERDGKPFRIRYAVRGALTTVYPVVCEAEGVAGQVRVFKTNGKFADVSSSDVEEYLSGKRDEVAVRSAE